MSVISNDASIFEQIYKEKINAYARQINRQFRAVTNFGQFYQTTIKIVDNGSKIEVIVTDCGTAEEKSHLILYIGYQDILIASKSMNLDLFDAFCKVVTHEYMHFLCEHLDRAHLNKVYTFCKGLIYYQDFYSIKMDPFFIYKSDEIIKLDENLITFDPILLNIAQDFEINSIINMTKPFLRASDYGLPEGLDDIHYYAILYHILFNPEENYIRDYYSHCIEKLKELYKGIKEQRVCCGNFNSEEGGFTVNINGSEIPLDENGHIKLKDIYNPTFETKPNDQKEKMIKSSTFNGLQGKLPGFLEKMNCAKTGIWKDFYDVYNLILKTETSQKLSYIDKVNDWTKFNNRKDTELLYPGKRERHGALERKIGAKSVLFVDISASMARFVAPLFTLCDMLCKKLNLQIVFYDAEIRYIFESTKNLQLEPFIGGGTNISYTIEEYTNNFKRPNKIYIISDTYDKGLYKLFKEGAVIFKIRDNSIKLVKSEGEIWC